MPNITLTESAPVVVRFQIADYSDALHFADQADRDQYSAEQIEAMCQARYDNWLAVINAPRPEPDGPVVLSDDEYAQRIVDLCQQHGLTIASAPQQIMPADSVAMPYTSTVQEDYEALVAYLALNEAAGRG